MKNIKYVSYEHDDILLCRGTLTIVVDGVPVEYKDIITTDGYSYFPNGYSNPPEIVKGPWNFKSSELKECDNGLYKLSDVDILYTKEELDYIKYIINTEIEWGCCGACI